MKNITNKRLAELFDKFDSQLGMTEYVICKSRLSQDEKNAAAEDILSVLRARTALPEKVADVVQQMAKNVTIRSEQAGALWPSLVGD